MKRLVLTVATLTLMAGSAFAQQYGADYGYKVHEGGLKLNAEVNNTVSADYNTNVADGAYARAFQSIGTIHSGISVDAPLNNTVSADYNTNVAKGDDALACQSIGSIGEFAACREGYDGKSRKQY